VDYLEGREARHNEELYARYGLKGDEEDTFIDSEVGDYGIDVGRMGGYVMGVDGWMGWVEGVLDVWSNREDRAIPTPRTSPPSRRPPASACGPRPGCWSTSSEQNFLPFAVSMDLLTMLSMLAPCSV
jgi:hypothetical protein